MLAVMGQEGNWNAKWRRGMDKLQPHNFLGTRSTTLITTPCMRS